MEHNKEKKPWLTQATSELALSVAKERLDNAEEILDRAANKPDILADIDAIYQTDGYLTKQVKAMKAVLSFSPKLLERYIDFTAERVENGCANYDNLGLAQFSAFVGSHRNVAKFEENLIKEMENN